MDFVRHKGAAKVRTNWGDKTDPIFRFLAKNSQLEYLFVPFQTLLNRFKFVSNMYRSTHTLILFKKSSFNWWPSKPLTVRSNKFAAMKLLRKSYEIQDSNKYLFSLLMSWYKSRTPSYPIGFTKRWFIWKISFRKILFKKKYWFELWSLRCPTREPSSSDLLTRVSSSCFWFF